jgi:hypothetical protein
MNTRHLRLAAGVAVAALTCAGCIFSPREPEPPSGGPPIPWETPINTSIVLTNLRAALEGEGVSNTVDCFTDDYRFHVDPQDSLDAGQEAEQRYANWVLSDEEHAVNGIFANAADITVRFTNTVPPNEGQDDTYRKESYELTIQWQSGPHIHEEISYKGTATLYMRRDGTGRWAIYQWVDRRLDPPTHATWGSLRGDYRG